MSRPAQPPAHLGDFEQLVLLALLRLGESGYGMEVLREIEDRTGREVAIGAVYATLDRMEQKGLVRSRMNREEGQGRPRRVYQLEAEGKRALRTTVEAFERMLEGLDLARGRS